MAPGAGGRARGVAEVVEALGFGEAQIRNLCLAHGIWLVESVQVGLAMVTSATVSAELKFSGAQSASLTSLIFLGIAVGCVLSGLLADGVGRRPPVLACYALALVIQCASACANSYWMLALLRFCLGVGQGVGMPASLALVSETSPVGGRKLLQALRNVVFTAGGILCSVIVCADDASLEHLNWRRDLLLGAIPPAALGCAALMLLQESPVLLAALGRDGEAREVLETMRRLNRLDGSSKVNAVAGIDYDREAGLPAEALPSAAQGKLGWRQQTATIFGRHLGLITLTLASGAFTVNLVLYGHSYAFPKVALETHASLLAGHQGLMQACLGIPICLFVTFLAVCMSCKAMLLLAAVCGILGPALFAWTGGLAARSPLQEMLYLVSQNAPGLCATFGFLACFQLSVDLFPVRMSASSAAVVVAAGRLGSVAAPFLFEGLRRWQSFYYFMSALCTVLLPMALAFLPAEPGATSEAFLPAEPAATREAAEPLCAKP